MRNKILLLILLITALAVTGCMTTYSPENPKLFQHIKNSAFSATDNGFYTAEFVFRPKTPVIGTNKGHLIIHDYWGVDIPQLDIKASFHHPDKNIQAAPPKLKDAGRGLYLIDDIVLEEPGKWVLKLDIKGKNTDTVTLELPVVEEM